MSISFPTKIESVKIAKDFDLTHFGISRTISHLGSVKIMDSNHLYWAKNIENLEKITIGTVICNQEIFDKVNQKNNVTYLVSKVNSRLDFCKILISHFEQDKLIAFKNTVESHRTDLSILIGDNVFIGENVTIGSNTIIHHNVSIYSNTFIGDHCVIHSGVTLGTEGLGLEFDEELDKYIKFPQLGGVIIEDQVELGPGTTIRRAALENTIIGRGTKIGALCNIGHNSIIGKNCIFTCNVILGGSSRIGDKVFMGVGSIVKNGISIGDNSTIGQGAVVVKNVPHSETWVGNPALKIESR